MAMQPQHSRLAGHDQMAALAAPPPFAMALRQGREQTTVHSDRLGFRQLYIAQFRHWAGVSTSARALAAIGRHGLDEDTLALQSLLGWQAGSGSLFRGVTKLPAGTTVILEDGRLALQPPPDWPRAGTFAGSLDQAVAQAASLIQEQVSQALDEHPDLLLQLTGGLDSRILLAAVPAARRSSVRCLTLAVPGSPDLAIASGLTRRFAMPHQVISLPDLGTMDPAGGLDLVRDAAAWLDSASDPLAHAVLNVAEGELAWQPRLCGLGGEVVRGFYYSPALTRGLTRAAQVDRLARWRLFPNESVPDRVLSTRFRIERRTRALTELQRIFANYDCPWQEATDRFYLEHRMQRWAGALASASAAERIVMNPMLDPRFLALGLSLRTADRAGAKFLSRILCRLDPALAQIPLDGRPAPTAFAYPDLRSRSQLAGLTAGKAWRKVGQRLKAQGRGPAGGGSMADLVMTAWRHNPAQLNGVRGLDVIDGEWLDRVLKGDPADPRAVALLANLEAAVA